MNLDQVRERLWPAGEGGLILLMGASPLPNLLVAAALRPPVVAMICSRDTEPAVSRFVHVLSGICDFSMKRFGPDDHLTIRDPYRAAWIRDDVQRYARELAPYTLFYTGGTKAMAVQVCQVWGRAGGAPGRACYLSDRDRLLRFDDDTEVDIIDSVHLDLTGLADLHGVTGVTFDEVGEGGATASHLDSPMSRHGVRKDRGAAGVALGPEKVPGLTTQEDRGDPPRPTAQDADLVLEAVLRDPALASRLYDAGSVERKGRQECIEKPKDVEAPKDLHALVPGLSVGILDTSLHRSNKRSSLKDWGVFLRGTWLEHATGRLVCRAARQLPGASSRKTVLDVVAQLPADAAGTRRDFQLDVAHVWGPRLYAISCTTGGGDAGRKGEMGITKGKVFEVVVRSRQLGGELARAAVVSLHDDGERDELRREMAAEWTGDQRPPEVFGVSNVREWQRGDLSTLEGWLRS